MGFFLLIVGGASALSIDVKKEGAEIFRKGINVDGPAGKADTDLF